MLESLAAYARTRSNWLTVNSQIWYTLWGRVPLFVEVVRSRALVGPVMPDSETWTGTGISVLEIRPRVIGWRKRCYMARQDHPWEYSATRNSAHYCYVICRGTTWTKEDTNWIMPLLLTIHLYYAKNLLERCLGLMEGHKNYFSKSHKSHC